MPDRQSPTLRRRRLSAELRRLREEAGVSSTEVTRRLGWSSGKLTRFERGEWKRPNPRDVQDLCEVYGVEDDRYREYLMQLARDGRLKGWWDPYDKMLSEDTTTFFGLEVEAATVLVFEPLMVPGLLQTPDYARGVIRGGPVQLDEDEIETRVEIRMRRQEALRDSPPLKVVAVIDEAVLRRRVGRPDVMQAQIEHLAELARLPNVTLQMIPFSAGAHAGMTGSFNILQFPEPSDPDAVFADLVAGQMFIEEPTEVQRYHDAFLQLVGLAVDPANTLEILTNR